MQDYQYREKIFSKYITIVMVLVVGLLLLSLFYQLLVGPLGSNPASNLFLLGMAILFAAVAVNFSTLRIMTNLRGVSVGYGLLMHTIPWSNIEGCYLDETSVVMYGGWGIRLGRVKGKWRVVYNVIGGPRVVLKLKRGWYREFVFSTRNPQKVAEIINGKTH